VNYLGPTFNEGFEYSTANRHRSAITFMFYHGTVDGFSVGKPIPKRITCYGESLKNVSQPQTNLQ